MAVPNQLSGTLTASTSNSTADLIGQIGADGATFSLSGPLADSSVDGDSFMAKVAGLYSWTITAPFKFPGAAPQHGANPSGAYLTESGSGLYLTNVKAFDITIAAGFGASTDDTATVGETYVQTELLGASGSFTCLVDGTAAVKAPGEGDTVVFKIGDETTNDDILQMTVEVTGETITRQRGSVTEVQYTFESNGAIKVDGDNPLFPVSSAGTPENIPNPAFDTVRVTHATGKYVEGSAAFQSIQISRETGSVIGGSVTLQGSGAVTHA